MILLKENTALNGCNQSIRKSKFSLSFSLEHRIIIQQANLNNGLLTMQFTYDFPEQKKPQKIAISH
ncbi:MAG: hypothetical protein ACEY3J_03370 [Arsenophonus sp.]